MTHGMQMEEIASKWGQRPCQNDEAREFLRNAPPPPREGAPAGGSQGGGSFSGGFSGSSQSRGFDGPPRQGDTRRN
jgi:hypothetical protein